MDALRGTARVIGTIGFAAVAALALVAVGRRPELAVPVSHLGHWLRDGDPATVVVALLRWVALLGAGWLLVSTLLYVVASASRVPRAVRAVRWSTVPAVRRAVDAVCAASVVTSVVLAPTAAGAARPSDPPSVSLVRDGRGADGGIAVLPSDTETTTTTTTTTTARSVSPTLPAPVAAPASTTPPPTSPPSTSPASVPPAVATDDVVVAVGDNLWVIAARRLAVVSGRAPADVTDVEIAPYWVRVCDANRDRLASGDPDLVFPGERVVLPPR